MHLSAVPHNRFGDLVEVALRVKQSTMAMYQSRQERKRSAPGNSKQSSGQYSRKRNKGRGYRGRVQVEELPLVRISEAPSC